jgi:hypothetical protein
MVNCHLNLSADFPRQLFADASNSRYSFCEYDLALSADFWRNVALLNKGLGHDQEDIVIYMIEPRIGEDLRAGSGNYGLLVGDPNSSAEAYETATAMPFSAEPFDCMNIISSKIAICPTSATWFLFGSRYYEVCVLRHPNLSSFELGDEWVTAAAAIDQFFVGGKSTIDEKFVIELERNYG